MEYSHQKTERKKNQTKLSEIKNVNSTQQNKPVERIPVNWNINLKKNFP